jgi:hypothetical protein
MSSRVYSLPIQITVADDSDKLNPNFYIEHQRERRKFSIKVFKGGVLGFADCQNQKAFKTLFEHTQKTLVYNTYVNEKLHFLSHDISKNLTTIDNGEENWLLTEKNFGNNTKYFVDKDIVMHYSTKVKGSRIVCMDAEIFFVDFEEVLLATLIQKFIKLSKIELPKLTKD